MNVCPYTAALAKQEIISISMQNNKSTLRVGVMVAHRALTSTEQDRNLYPKPSSFICNDSFQMPSGEGKISANFEIQTRLT